MNNSNWKDIAEVIGIAAIVASLIFVALQMKQSQEIAIATQYQERTALTIETISARSQLPNTVEQIGAALEADFERYHSEEMSAADIGYQWFATRLSLAALDNAHYQWQSGFLSDEGWNMQVHTLRFLLRNEPMGRFIVEQRDLYRKSFLTICRELISEDNSISAESTNG